MGESLVREGDVIAFADHLYERGETFRAGLEYERYVFFFPDGPNRDRARFGIGLCYQKRGQWDLAVQTFRDFYEGPLATQAQFEVGRTWFLAGQYDRAREVFGCISDEVGGADEAYRDRARVAMGWCDLMGKRWREALETLRPLTGEQARWLAARAREGPRLSHKRPTVAGILSAVLPGAGQVYVGRYGDGAWSFLLAGSLTWAAVSSFHSDHPNRGYVLGALAFGLYAGNVYGAIVSALNFNRDAEDAHLNRIREEAEERGWDIESAK